MVNVRGQLCTLLRSLTGSTQHEGRRDASTRRHDLTASKSSKQKTSGAGLNPGWYREEEASQEMSWDGGQIFVWRHRWQGIKRTDEGMQNTVIWTLRVRIEDIRDFLKRGKKGFLSVATDDSYQTHQNRKGRVSHNLPFCSHLVSRLWRQENRSTEERREQRRQKTAVLLFLLVILARLRCIKNRQTAMLSGEWKLNFTSAPVLSPVQNWTAVLFFRPTLFVVCSSIFVCG